MEDRPGLKDLIYITFFLHLSSADTHSLQFFYTTVTPGINFPVFTAVGLVDGEECVHYNSNISKMIPKTEWMKKISTDNPQYWNNVLEKVKDHQDKLAGVMKILNQDEGNHTLQWMLGCGLDIGVTRGYSQYRYDGEHFFSLDLNWNLKHGQGTWTTADDKAKNFLMEWDPKGEKADYWKEYLKYNCIVQLNKFVPYSNKTLRKKDLPVNPVIQKHPACPEVVCHATGFFPKVVNITWRKDGEDVKEDVKLRVTFPNQDGSFQKRIILNVSAEDLQKHNYTCVIQHSSLKEETVLNVSKRRPKRDVGSNGGSCEESGGKSGGKSDGGTDKKTTTVVVSVVVVTVLVAVVAGVGIVKKKKRSCAPSPEVQTGAELHPLSVC